MWRGVRRTANAQHIFHGLHLKAARGKLESPPQLRDAYHNRRNPLATAWFLNETLIVTLDDSINKSYYSHYLEF